MASLLWQVLLLPDSVTAWDKGIYRPPSCLWIISVSLVSWTVMGYKQSKRIENLERFGFGELFSSNHQLCWLWRHLWILTAFSFGLTTFAFYWRESATQWKWWPCYLYAQMGNHQSKYPTVTGGCMQMALYEPLASRAFSFLWRKLNHCVSSDDKNIAILEVLFSSISLVFYNPGSFPETNPDFQE